jgi:hypothetical protein
MKKYLKFLIPIFFVLGIGIAYAHTNSTIISRLLLDHPDLGYEAGAGLLTKVRTMYTKIGDNLNSRYSEWTAQNDSTTVTLEHNFNIAFSDLRIALYSGIGSGKTRIVDPVASGWTIAVNGTDPLTKLDITTPSSGQPHSFSAVVEMAHEYYPKTFNATTDWGSASGGYYTITLASTAHLKGGNPMTKFYKTSGSDFEEVEPNTVTITATGNVVFTVMETPDGRFAGKVLVK